MRQSTSSFSTQQQITQILQAFGVENFGFAQLKKPFSLDIYQSWLSENRHGDMTYLERHLPDKTNPERLLPQAKSTVVMAFSYYPSPHSQSPPLQALKIAKYASGDDYHHWIKEKLDAIIIELKKYFETAEFMAATDSSPILEREWAYWAGLGWFGKNTCLIHQKRGSYFFIAEIYTTLALDLSPSPHPDMCGTCNRCIEACPTSAILPNKLLDARKCISYLTIESKSVPPIELRSQIGEHFFGCDICQDVCPWNNKVLNALIEQKPEEKTDQDLSRAMLLQDLRFILKSSNHELMQKLAYTPLSRARGFGLKRNAMIVIANKRLSELRTDVEQYTSDVRLAELAHWTLGHL